MPRPKIWDTPHQAMTIHNWINYGLILREGETYKGIYSFYMSIDNCNLCNVKFNDENYNDKKCMDHDHATGYFRQVICNQCNRVFDLVIKTKTGHRWINPYIQKRNSKISVLFRHRRVGFKYKTSASLTKLIAYSFIQLIKIPA
mgnify:CR=1 FL=1